MAICADTFKSKVHSSSRQPGGISCGVCVLIEIQRIADGKMDSRRDRKFDATELLRCRAKWACELINDQPGANPRYEPDHGGGGGEGGVTLE